MDEEGKEVYVQGGEENAMGGKGRSREQEGEGMMRRVEGCDMLAVQEDLSFLRLQDREVEVRRGEEGDRKKRMGEGNNGGAGRGGEWDGRASKRESYEKGGGVWHVSQYRRPPSSESV